MAFLTPEQIKAVRIKGSKVVTIEHLEKEVRIIKMSGAAQVASIDLNAAVRAGSKKPTDTFLFLLENALAELDGTPLTADDALQIFQLLPQDSLLKLVGEISASIGDGVKVEVSKAPAEEQTPAEKKG